jgi:hypothetical protein
MDSVTTTKPINTAVLRIALGHLRTLKARDAAYEEDVREWYSRGEGRTHGYTYPACIHGTSRWTDYDNICGPCEDGLSNYELALGQAWSEWRTFEARCEWARVRPDDMPGDLLERIMAWAMEPLGSAFK